VTVDESAPVRVRRAGPGDAGRLRDGNVAMALETEGLALEPWRVLAGVEAVLRDPAKGFYLVATDSAGAALGQLLVTYEWSDWRAGVLFWIQSVYVWPEARRRGVYRALHAAVLEEARGRGAERVAGIRLYVHRDNAGAQAVYRAMGMEETAYRVFEEDFVLP